MKKLSIMIFMILALIVIGGCCLFSKHCSKDKSSGKAAVDTEIIMLDESNNGESIILSIGRNLSLNLKANPSTGYRWAIIESDEKILPLISRDFKQREAEPGMVGVGGTLNLTFKAIKAGQSKLKLEYSRPLASEDDVAQYFEIDVNVK